MTENLKINPNSADKKTLQSISGIGPTTAARIIDARPFTSPEDLLRVTGISIDFLNKIRERLDFEIAPDAETPAPAVETAGSAEEVTLEPEENQPAEATEPGEEPEEAAPSSQDTDEIVKDELVAEAETAARPPEEATTTARQETPAVRKDPRYITRGQAFWMSASAAFFAFILAVSLTLAVLSALNGGLRFARPDQVRAVQNEVGDLQREQETLGADITGLRTRMDNFEALGGRVTMLETDVATVNADLEAVAGDVEGLEGEIAGLSETVDELVADTGRFQAFLEGLADLLSNLVQGGGDE